MRRAVVPVLGNLAWMPLPAVEELEIFDRFNGIPTLGVLKSAENTHLFWCVHPHLREQLSLWIYVPLADQDEQHVASADPLDLLTGPVFNASESRYVTLGVAQGNRLFFEREWQLPGGLSRDGFVKELLHFTQEALSIALRQDLPGHRRTVMKSASRAVDQLAGC